MPELKPTRSGSDVKITALVAVIVVLIVTSATGFYLVTRNRDTAPRLDAPIEEVAKFVSREEFRKLPFERQRHYMKVLDDREQELDRAYHDEKITALQYQRAMEYGWFGKEIPRMEKYASLGPEEQPAYIDSRLDKKDDKERKRGKNKDGEGESLVSADAGSSSSSSGGLSPVKRDEQTEKDIPRTWPAEWREKWKKYREALKDRREERDEEREGRESQEEAAKTAAKPG